MQHLHIYETEKKLALWDDLQDVSWKWSYNTAEQLNDEIKEAVSYKGTTNVYFVTKRDDKDYVYKIESYRDSVKYKTEEY